MHGREKMMKWESSTTHRIKIREWNFLETKISKFVGLGEIQNYFFKETYETTCES